MDPRGRTQTLPAALVTVILSTGLAAEELPRGRAAPDDALDLITGTTRVAGDRLNWVTSGDVAVEHVPGVGDVTIVRPSVSSADSDAAALPRPRYRARLPLIRISVEQPKPADDGFARRRFDTPLLFVPATVDGGGDRDDPSPPRRRPLRAPPDRGD